MDGDIIFYLAILSISFGLLVTVSNLITEVLKRCFCWKKDIPVQIMCVIVSLILTICTVVAFCQIFSIPMTWYIIFASIVYGFIVACGAMNGYDYIIKNFAPFIQAVIELFKKG